jgi:hypothetical protein
MKLNMIKIKNDEIIEDVVGDLKNFPKYSTQLINLANQNAQGTRPKVVGQMTELIQEFPGNSYEEWVKCYKAKYPEAILEATQKIFGMINNFKEIISIIDEKLVHQWVEDLVLTKTYSGLRFQESILKRIASIKRTSYRLANPEEESKGIDGFIGDVPISIKSITYNTKDMLPENIQAKIVYYEKKKDGITISYDF